LTVADTTTSTAGSSGSSGGFAGTLKAKWGPLPVWGWLGIVTIALLGWYLWQQHQAGAAGTPAQQPTPSDVGQPGVVVINQDGPEGQTTPPTAPPPEPKHKGGGPSPEQPHKVTRQEAQALLKEKHTVYTRNRGGTYVPVTKLSGVHDQLYVGERAWDIWTKAHPKAKG
jgi:hypothetical protein